MGSPIFHMTQSVSRGDFGCHCCDVYDMEHVSAREVI